MQKMGVSYAFYLTMNSHGRNKLRMYCVDLREAVDLAKEIYPDLKDQGFLFPNQGFENFTMMTNYEVIRIARNLDVASCMDLEVQTLQAINGNFSVSTPVVHDFNRDHKIIRMSRLKGTPLLPERLMRLSEEERQQIAGQVGQFMAELHEKFSSDRSYLRDAFRSHREDAMRKLDALKEKNLGAKIHDHFEKIKNYILNFENHSDDPTRIHGDLKGENILYDDVNKRISVCDFTGCRPAYAHQDLRITMCFYPAAFSAPVIREYESRTGRKVASLAHTFRDFVKVAEHREDDPYPFAIDEPVMNLTL